MLHVSRPSSDLAVQSVRRVVDWLKDFASQRSLEIKGDSYGNQVIYRPGSGGGEGAPTIVLQVLLLPPCQSGARGSLLHHCSSRFRRTVRSHSSQLCVLFIVFFTVLSAWESP